MFAHLTHRLFVLLFLLGIFIPSTVVFAANSCACTSSDTDCRTISVKPSKQSAADACITACKTELGTKFTSAAYDADPDAATYKCAAAHQAFTTNKDASSASTSSTSTTPPKATITPTLNVDIPGLSFTSAVSGPCSSSGTASGSNCIKSNFLSDYLTGIYQFLIGASITIAIVMLLIGGLQYTMGAASEEMIKKGKTRMSNAVTGLVLLLGVYLILYTTNPQLTLLKTIELQNVQGLEMPEVDEGDVVPEGQTPPSGGLPTPGRLCHSIDECKKLCDNPSLLSKYNIEVPVLTNSKGFINAGKAKGTANLQTALKEAGAIAVSMNASYTLVVPGGECGYRSVLAQVKKACDDINKNGGNSLTHGILAWPGGSNHGSGVAIDIQLESGGKNLMTMSAKASADPKFKDPADNLAKIMNQAGFVRYGKEIWHFELKGSAGSFCRCSYPNCPFPPHC